MTLQILCHFYSIPNAVGLILSTHLLRHGRNHYYLSPKSEMNMSFISHQSLYKDFQKAYFCVTPVDESEEWPYAFSQWHPILMAKSGVTRDLTEEKIFLLQDISTFHQIPQSFPLHSLTDDPHALAACDLFPHFPSDKIYISFLYPVLIILFFPIGFL